MRIFARTIVNLPEAEVRNVARRALQKIDVHRAQDLIVDGRTCVCGGHSRELFELGCAWTPDDDLCGREAVAQAIPETAAREFERGRACYVDYNELKTNP